MIDKDRTRKITENLYSSLPHSRRIGRWDELAKKDAISAAVSATSETEEKLKTRPQITWIVKNIKKPGSILDLGCGYGRIHKYLDPECYSEYYGVDASLEMLALFDGRPKLTAPSDSREKFGGSLHLLHSDITDLPVVDESIDTVITCAVLLHNSKSNAALIISAARRVLRKGGVFLCISSFPNAHCLGGLQGILYNYILSILGQGQRNGPVRYYSKSEVISMFVSFESVRVRPAGFEVIPKTILFLPRPLNKVWRLIFADPVNNLGKHLLPERIKILMPTHFDVVAER